jgi:hypothetical protein
MFGYVGAAFLSTTDVRQNELIRSRNHPGSVSDGLCCLLMSCARFIEWQMKSYLMAFDALFSPYLIGV